MKKETKICLGMIVGGIALAYTANNEIANRMQDGMSLWEAATPYLAIPKIIGYSCMTGGAFGLGLKLGKLKWRNKKDE